MCRSSALCATLQGDPMHAAHQQRPLPDSSDWAIRSPLVPVFRRDDSAPLDAHGEQRFPQAFDQVVFAITDGSPERATLGPFARSSVRRIEGRSQTRLSSRAPNGSASLGRGVSGFPQQGLASSRACMGNITYPPSLWITLWASLSHGF